MKKAITLISIGLLNFLHGTLHIIQFIQSLLLANYSIKDHSEGNDNIIISFLEHPVFAFFWAFVGILTFIIGFKDYRHHKKCDH